LTPKLAAACLAAEAAFAAGLRLSGTPAPCGLDILIRIGYQSAKIAPFEEDRGLQR